MQDYDGDIRRLMDAAARTEIVRAPRQHLHTFGVTKLHYYIVTEPSYRELVPGAVEAVIREGDVAAQRPAVVTPTYMAHLEGFGEDAYRYFTDLARKYGSNSPGLLYQYANEPGEMSIVEGTAQAVAERISKQLGQDGNSLAAVIKGVDELWDVSLLKFIFEYTLASLAGNLGDLQSRRLLDPEPNLEVPRAAVQRIDALFQEAEQGGDPAELKRELDRWELFDYYQDRFLNLFRRKRG